MAVAIIVTYNPEPNEVTALVAGLRLQVSQVIVVDNASDAAFSAELDRLDAQVIRNPENRGLAGALNQGIREAMLTGTDAVILFDQDSAPSADLVAYLEAAYLQLSQDAKVAAVGPQFIDARNGRAQPFVRIGFPLNQKIIPSSTEPVACDYLITSGCYIPRPALDDIGLMDEGLFIDNVDMDWCFRASAKGYRLFGVPAAVMMHRIGDHLAEMPGGLGQFMVHSPRRLYYSSRNRVLLYRRSHVTLKWVLQDIPRFALKFARLVTLVKPRAKIARAMLLGLFDGIAGRTGVPKYRFD